MSDLIEASELHSILHDPSLAIFDCRFDLFNKQLGQEQYLAAHIPGASFVDLEKDLSDMSDLSRGRHPIPSVEMLCQVFSKLGIDKDTKVVIYDQSDSSMAARLWWLLKYLGHDSVQILNGGITAWSAAGLPLQSGNETRESRKFIAHPQKNLLVPISDVLTVPCLIDSRDLRRYRGEWEPIDPVAGHIPGAKNHFFKSNLSADGKFLSSQTLKENFSAIIGNHPAQDVVFYCGSGPTACHNAFAFALAGFGQGHVYMGSFSEWCTDPNRPIEKGSNE